MPNANIANVPSGTGVTLLLNALIGDGPKLFKAKTPKVYDVPLFNPDTVIGEPAAAPEKPVGLLRTV